jgi:hypothetical protein
MADSGNQIAVIHSEKGVEYRMASFPHLSMYTYCILVPFASFDNDAQCLKKVFGGSFDVSKWEKNDIKDLKALKARLNLMKDGDKFSAAKAVFMAKIMEVQSIVEELGLMEWSKPHCANPVCQVPLDSKKKQK